MNNDIVSVFLGLGSNVGDLKHNLDTALQFISQRMKIEQVSSLYDTSPEVNTNQPRFLNMIIRASTSIEPQPLLTMLKGIESKLGRVTTTRYSPRPIDIDILFYGNSIIDTPDLVIPHPHMHERAFVLVPLAEIAPNFIHPKNGKTISKMLSELKKGIQGVFRLEPGLS